MVKIIAFEGIDASGKETQAFMLTQYLRQVENANVLQEAFPRYDKPIGGVIRQWLDGKVELTPEALHMLYEADRQDFTNKLKATNAEFAVLDRFTLSNQAFGMAKGIRLSWLRSLQTYVAEPDLTFVIDVPVDTSLERRTEGRDRHEVDIALLELTRVSYQVLSMEDAAQHEKPIYRIDGTQSVEAIHDQVLEILHGHFG